MEQKTNSWKKIHDYYENHIIIQTVVHATIIGIASSIVTLIYVGLYRDILLQADNFENQMFLAIFFPLTIGWFLYSSSMIFNKKRHKEIVEEIRRIKGPNKKEQEPIKTTKPVQRISTRSNKLDTIDSKSLLQANATVLAGALIFLTLLNNTFNIIAAIFFLLGIWSIIGSIMLCLWAPKEKEKEKENSKSSLGQVRRGLCLGGLLCLFGAISTFIFHHIG